MVHFESSYIGLIKMSCFRSHSPDSLRGQIFLNVVRAIVFDEVTGVGEGNDGVGNVLTEDHYNVPRVPDQAPQHGVGDLFDLRGLQVCHHPLKRLLSVQYLP